MKPENKEKVIRIQKQIEKLLHEKKLLELQLEHLEEMKSHADKTRE